MPLGLLILLIGVVVAALVNVLLGAVLIIVGLVLMFAPAPTFRR